MLWLCSDLVEAKIQALSAILAYQLQADQAGQHHSKGSVAPHMDLELMTLPAVRSGEAMSHNLLQKAMVSELFLVVALTMALTPLMAEIGQRLGKAFEKSDVKVGRPLFQATAWLTTSQKCSARGICIKSMPRPINQTEQTRCWLHAGHCTGCDSHGT